MKPALWSLRRKLAVAARGTCPKCGPSGGATIVRVDDVVLVCDVCLHEIETLPPRMLPRRRRHELNGV